MFAAGVASQHVSPRTIGLWAGVLSSLTAVYWIAADRLGLLQFPDVDSDQGEEIEVRPELPA